MAGVNTIMMSLWEVDDEATQLLMTEFYRNYVNGMSKMDSLHNAQKKVQETPGFSDPEYWAAFILLDALN
jgi:CHAT domain-containing protein